MSDTNSLLVDDIDAWLPQVQCTKCGYPRCRAYAEALATGEADINRCPPGADITIAGLAKLLGKTIKPLDKTCGEHQQRRLAVINEAWCIGCTLCIQACPVDAIVGAAKLMHTVIAEQCTGCDLCLPPCPMDCISFKSMGLHKNNCHWRWPEYAPEQTEQARQRHQARLARLERKQHTARRQAPNNANRIDRETIRAEIHAAVARVKQKKQKR